MQVDPSTPDSEAAGRGARPARGAGAHQRPTSRARYPRSHGQEALHHGPGRYCELLVFEPSNPERPGEVLSKAAELIKSVETDLSGKPLNMLVALGPGYLQWLDRPHFAAEADCWKRPGSQLQVLVQIAGETEDDRTYARRLTRRLFRDALQLVYQSSGGRHLLSKGPLGYPDMPPAGKPDIPFSRACDAQDATWLLFQQCRQHVDEFYALSSEQQDRIMGRPKLPTSREELEQRRPPPNSHVAVSRNGRGAGASPLVRRSFAYDTYDDSGLNFLAVAADPKDLDEALDRFTHRDELSRFVELGHAGLFFVPGSAEWLQRRVQRPAPRGPRAPGGSAERAAPERATPAQPSPFQGCTEPGSPPAPLPEEPFYPKHPVVLYDMTPGAKAFFLQVFHQHKDNFDDLESGVLRKDIELLTRGFCKLVYGGRIAEDSPLYTLLDLAFTADLAERVAAHAGSPHKQPGAALFAARHDLARRQAAYDEALRQRRGESAAGDGTASHEALLEARRLELESSRDHLRQLLSEHALVDSFLKAAGLEVCWARAITEVVLADAETMTNKADKAEVDRIAELCRKATDEARVLNAESKEYMTFPC